MRIQISNNDLGSKNFLRILLFSFVVNTILLAQNNYSLRFEEDSYVNIPNTFNYGEAITLSFWLKPDYSQGDVNVTILQRGNTFAFRLVQDSQGNLILDYALNGPIIYTWNSSNIAVPTEIWSYINFVYNGSEIIIYLNGISEYVRSGLNGEVNEQSGQLQIGNESGVAYRGNIDELSVWDIAITQGQIWNFMYGLTGNEENLVGYWKI